MKKIIATLIAAVIVAIMGLFSPEAEPQTQPAQPQQIQTQPAETRPAETRPAETRPAETVPPISGNGLTVHFIDVGQADCALLECDGEFMIVDGGNVDDGQLVVSYLKQMGVEKLEAVVCSHAHEDHVGGLPAVLSVFDAETVYAPVTEYDTKVFRDFVSKTEKRAGAITVPAPGDQFSLGSTQVTVMGPVREYDDPNDTSIVLRVSYGESDFLFTGDMEVTAENDMLDYWGEDRIWEAEVLKVGHHGSETSSGYRFVYEVCPDYGVISVGEDNSYGHPHEKPVSRLQDAGVVLLRTDRLGHVIATTDGKEISFIWENQNAQPEDVEPADPAQTVLYGNKKSKKFHTYDCKNLPGENNRVIFETYDAAVSAGFDPCGSCIG